VSDVYIAQDDNGSRGFGFVKMDTEEGVAKALELNGQYLEGREVHCEVAREREDRSQSSGKTWNSPAGENAGFTPNPRPGADRTVFVRGFDKFQDEDTVSRSVSLAARMQSSQQLLLLNRSCIVCCNLLLLALMKLASDLI
jgi:nucleolin